jgi:hypothetical protein
MRFKSGPIPFYMCAFGASPFLTLGPEASQRLVGRGAADPDRIGCLGHGPALVEDATHQQLATEYVETRPMLGHESHLRLWSFDTPDPERWPSVVNNVCVKYR